MNKPTRIQRKRTKGYKTPANTIYVGRPSKWGNNYVVGTESHNEDDPPIDAKIAVELFKYYQLPEMIEDGDVAELRGKNLSCWCKLGEPCHADVLLEFANQ